MCWVNCQVNFRRKQANPHVKAAVLVILDTGQRQSSNGLHKSPSWLALRVLIATVVLRATGRLERFTVTAAVLL